MMKQPKVAGKAPQMENLEKDKTYAWCTCGNSENQPWCNGAHQGSEFSPKVFKAEESKKAAICLCKQTKNPPYCDGSHVGL
jgi:CDGSH-type Zn-finger protein|tara:strand:- start:30253 stop:30495 length:243 start_codon:yes stop_codon:yes gene_type:complete